jgi:hypothetical protein
MVPAPLIHRMLESPRAANIHYQRRSKDLDGRWIAAGRSGSRRTQQTTQGYIEENAEAHARIVELV